MKRRRAYAAGLVQVGPVRTVRYVAAEDLSMLVRFARMRIPSERRKPRILH